MPLQGKSKADASAEVRVGYDTFTDDVLALSAGAQAELDDLIARLEWPYDPPLQRACILHEDDLYEFPLSDGSRVFWVVRKKWKRMIVVITGIERNQ